MGEFTILQGAFEANRIWAAFAVSGVILGAAYLLWLYQRTVLGQVTNAKNLAIPDMSLREIAIFVPLIAWAVWIGVYPKPYFDVLRRPVAEIVQRVRPEYYAGRNEGGSAEIRRDAGTKAGMAGLEAHSTGGGMAAPLAREPALALAGPGGSAPLAGPQAGGGQ